MIRSMTGFGRAAFEVEGVGFEVEIRTVNHRHLDVRARLPRALAAEEVGMKARVQERLQRGKVDVSVALPAGSTAPPRLEVDFEAAAQLVAAARKLAQAHDLDDSVRVTELRQKPLGLPLGHTCKLKD